MGVLFSEERPAMLSLKWHIQHDLLKAKAACFQENKNRNLLWGETRKGVVVVVVNVFLRGGKGMKANTVVCCLWLHCEILLLMTELKMFSAFFMIGQRQRGGKYRFLFHIIPNLVVTKQFDWTRGGPSVLIYSITALGLYVYHSSSQVL